jgi:ABC-type branched-subunit amino acid transport system substrate-binding protein
MQKLGLIVSAVLWLVPCTQAQNADKVVRIGVVSDFSGKMAYWGHQTQLGAMLAKEDLARSGIVLEPIFEDTALEAAKAVTAGHKLLAADHVDAVYAEFSPLTVAISPVLKNAKKLFVYDSGANSPVATNPYAFKTFTDYVAGCRTLAEYWKGKGIVKVGVLKMAIEAGELCLSGVRVVYPDAFESSYNPNEEVRTQVMTMKQRGIEAIFNVAFEPDLMNTIKTMQDLNYSAFVGTNENSMTNQVSQKYPSFLPQIVVIGLPPVNAEFVARIVAKDPQNTKANIEAAALSFTHLKQMARAISACGDKGVECQIAQVAKSPADNTIMFQGWIDRIADLKLKLRTWQDGKEIDLN